MKKEHPTNQCGACHEDFSSLELFDRHRVGVHDYTFKEGLDMNPPREDGRRCLDPTEMAERGWRLNDRQLWFDPVRSSRAAQAFRPSAQRPRADS